MSLPDILTLAVLPAFLLLDYFVPPAAGFRSRWWRSRAAVVIAVNFGMALLVGARVAGPVATILFALLIHARIRVEEDALRHPPCN